MYRLICAFLIGALASPALASWQQAESDHFVIYADDSAKNVRRFAEILESYHSAMEVVTGRKIGKPSPSNRVTIYAVGSARDVQALVDTKSTTLQGFYIPRAGGSVAFVQDLRSTGSKPDDAMSTLLHEYAHHFLISSQRMTMPKWMSEGAAEFFSSAAFQSDGRIDLGLPNFSRDAELAYADKVPIRHLLDEELYTAKAGKRYDAFYGRSWLLYHYLMFSEERQGQLNKYWLETGRGTPRLEAAEKTFGDLDALESALNRYIRQRSWKIYSAMPEQIQVGPISVLSLSPGHAAMLPVIIRSKRGVDEAQAKDNLVKAQAVASQYPQDAAVLSALAEAEHDAGNLEAAITVADRALAVDPAAKNALVQKGLALFAQAEDADDLDAAYTKAMEPFVRLKGLESDHPYPLMYEIQAYYGRGEIPPQAPRSALVRAAKLAPFDLGLAYQVGQLFASEGSVKAAIGALQPIAADPHQGSFTARAKAMIAYLETKPEGVPVGFAELFNSSKEPEEAAAEN